MPSVTVVTICYRNPEDLRRTLASLQSLDPAFFERLVIDGSPDEVCEAVSAGFDHVRHLRGPDAGKYDAMNKGIAAASGDSLLFMNSGDVLISADLLQAEVRKRGAHLAKGLAYGDAIYDIAGTLLDVPAPEPTQLAISKGDLPCHQAILIPTAFHRAHPYDRSMHFAADTKLLRQAFSILPATRLPFPVARFAYGGVSNSPGSWRSIWKQLVEMREAHGQDTRQFFGSAILLVRRKLLQFVFGENWFRRVQRERLIATGRARLRTEEQGLT